jgi:hypothetical protein
VFTANAAWLSIAAIAHNLVRAAGALASLLFAKARAATIRRDLIAVAARTARHGRGRLTLHLPEGWHRQHEWLNLLPRPTARPPQRPDRPRTGPHPATAVTATPNPAPEVRNPDKPQNRRAAGRLRPDSLWKTPRAGIGPEPVYRELAGGSRLRTGRLWAESCPHSCRGCLYARPSLRSAQQARMVDLLDASA